MSVLPLYTQRPSTVTQIKRTVFRLREKYVLLLSIVVFCGIVYSAFTFLPEGTKWDAEGRPAGGRFPPRNRSLPRRHDSDEVHLDPHLVKDSAKLQQKIDDSVLTNLKPPESGETEQSQGDLKPKAPQSNQSATEDADSEDAVNTRRRDKIKEMMMWAWDGYAQYAWGSNEVRPVSKTGHSASIFGSGNIGASIIDGLDTLYIMGLLERFEAGKKWVELSLNLEEARGDLSVFETNIRFVAGLLSCYAFTKDEMFKRKAAAIADLLLPAFDTPTGIPYALINPKTKQGKNWGWASGGASILSEFGTIHLEFEYLSHVTGNQVYADKVRKIRQILKDIEKPNGLYPNYLNPKTGKWSSRHHSVGALGDSFYEYLFKGWLLSSKTDADAKKLYDDSVVALEGNLLQKSVSGMTYFAELKGSRMEHKMDHLACFIGGLFALQSEHEVEETKRSHFLGLAQDIGHTCHESYIRTDTHLGPESFRFTNDVEAKAINDRDKYYILRPEVIETYFYLWRVTKQQKYRDWAWDAAQAIEKHCKADAGYSGIRNVYSTSPQKDDVQQSFFLAETLKYLYLIFSSDDVIPLNEWVFNTEAHPFPIWGRGKEEEGGPPAKKASVTGEEAQGQAVNGTGNQAKSGVTKFEPGFRVEKK